MAYDLELAQRLRNRLSELPNLYEKAMFGGLCFMYNEKMCLGIVKDEMMCRINPAEHDNAVEKNGCRSMDFTGKTMRGYVLIDEFGMKSEADFNYWVELALEFNSLAKKSKKKK